MKCWKRRSLRPRTVIFALMLLCSTGTLLGCQSLVPRLGQPELTTLRIGVNSWPGYQLAYYAQAKGYFKRRNLDVELVQFINQQDNIRATMRGALDASFVPLWETLQVDPGAESPAIVLVADVSAGSDGIVARPGLKSVADLSGKTVGVKLGTIPHLVLLEALGSVNLPPYSVTIQDLTNELSAKAVKAGKLDAAVIWEPLLSNTAQQSGGKVIFTTRDVNSLVVDTLATRSQFAQTHQSALKQFTLAWFDAIQDVETKPNQVFQTIGKILGQSPSVFAKDYAGLKKGDRAMNQQMFLEGRLAEIIQKTKSLLKADLRHNRVIRQDIVINPTAVQQGLQEWQP